MSKAVTVLFSFLAAALIALSGCATSGPTSAQEAISFYRMGVNRMQSGNNEAALYEFNRALAKNPDDENANFAAGIVHYRQQNYESAIKSFRKVISINSKNADAHNNLALAYIQKKDYPAAIRELRTAIDNPLYQNRALSLINLANIYSLTGDYEKAAESFREAILVMPESTEAMV
ncbi:MAG TPA: tetratricopeptide repeat protein, partial [Nitrospirota bacterium]